MLKQFRRTAAAVVALVIELKSPMLKGTSGVFLAPVVVPCKVLEKGAKKHPLHSLL